MLEAAAAAHFLRHGEEGCDDQRPQTNKNDRKAKYGLVKLKYIGVNLAVLYLAERHKLTSQIGYALCVDLKLVTVEVFAHQAEKRVQDAYGPCNGGRRGVSVAWAERKHTFSL